MKGGFFLPIFLLYFKEETLTSFYWRVTQKTVKKKIIKVL